MTEGGEQHYARAVHVQMFCTCFCFAALTGQTVGTADAKLADHMYAIPALPALPLALVLWLPVLYDAGCARQNRKGLFERGPPVL